MATAKYKKSEGVDVQDISLIEKSRTYTRQKIAKLCTKIENSLTVSPMSEKLAFTDRLIALQSELISIDKNILNFKLQNDASERELDDLADGEERYEELIARTLTSLRVGSGTAALPLGQELSEQDNGKIRLPQVPFPEFSNKKGENFKKFLHSFESIIHKYNLNNFEKFIFLRKQLHGPPKVLIDSLDIEDQEYDTARNLLLKAFDSAQSSKWNVLSMISELKLSKSSDPYIFIGEVQSIQSGIKNLKINVDDFLQFFIWNALNEDFQNILIQITNKTRPILSEIMDNIFIATDRYNKNLDKNKSKPQQKINNYENETMAVNVKPDRKLFCALCSHDKKQFDHSMPNCKIYDSNKKRFDKLRMINGCTRCSFKNHKTSECKFKFKSNCRNCNGLHMSHLCMKNASNNSKPVNSQTATQNDVETADNVSSNNLSMEVLNTCSDSSIILPTFSASIVDDSGMRVPVRVFKDGGCQRSFICRSLADSLDLKTINPKLNLKINGFNSSKIIQTKTVLFKIMIGNSIHEIETICIENIRTKFNVNGINKVISTFRNKKYDIADVYLGTDDKVVLDNIDLLFGTDLDPLLPLNYIKFGKNNP